MESKHRSFWKWLVLYFRAMSIDNEREARERRELEEEWNWVNRDFIRKYNKEIDREIARRYKYGKNNNYGCDESSCTGHVGGGDCGGDGGF